jgi:hypothetical protein
MNKTLKLSSGLFWDIDPDELDMTKDAGLIITRVLSRGTREDWNGIKSFYGLAKIKQASINARYLDKKTLIFCSTIFSIPIKKFRCYTFRQLMPEPWNY